MGAMLLCALMPLVAMAQYYKPPESDLDPKIMIIDEKKHLGAKLDGDTPLIIESGKEVPLSSFLGKPLIVVLSYYTCDGSCSVINNELMNLLDDVELVKHGKDYRILTLSFDTHDNLETTGAFRNHLDGSEDFMDSWTFATFKNEADLKAQTEKIGFKFFWSPQDRLFLHPGTFLFFSPEGRLIRILYPPQAGAKDIELAVMDAKQGQFRPQEIINFAISLCYSYNFKEGKYTLSIPLFVGVGALLFGISTAIGSIVVFKYRRRRKLKEGNIDNAQTT
jgi:protein SCO1/2